MEKKEILLRWVLTVATVLLLVIMACQCLDIYITGNKADNLDENGLYIQPVYQVADVIARLSRLRFWAIGYFVLLITVWMMLPGVTRKKSALPMEPDNRLRLMKQKLIDLPEAAYAEELLRRKNRLVTGVFVTFCAAMSLTFLLNQDNFISWDLELVMGQMLVHTLPWIIVGLAAVIAATFVCRRSMEREIQLLKGVSGSEVPVPVPRPSFLHPVRILLYALAVVLTATGIYNGGMRDVLVKAINICTECIGLG